MMKVIIPIAQHSDFELADVWNTEGLGTVNIYSSKTKNQYVIEKPITLKEKFRATPEEIQLLEIRIKELPEEVTLASADYMQYDPSDPLFNHQWSSHVLYLDYSAMNMKKHLQNLKQEGLRISDSEALGYFGFLVGLGSFMEQGLEFHRSVCLKNLLLIEGKLQLMNPYISDNHIRVVIQDFIRPILNLGEQWEPSLFVDDQLRMELSKSNLGIRQINELHRAYIRQMHSDCCLVFLAIANMQEESRYTSAEGVKNISNIETDINVSIRYNARLCEADLKVS